ncbi:hypothetical protein TRAPUB_1921 [Trametes pubescens]|uniref:Uncharacterized protein n=1 Tax=Trametes pubescens TaxID=154538 RepID=A0A1M2VI33_TRAPU|nr:hypothetical protein TRAPUB_1921 [Trametes pubescens]
MSSAGINIKVTTTTEVMRDGNDDSMVDLKGALSFCPEVDAVGDKWPAEEK